MPGPRTARTPDALVPDVAIRLAIEVSEEGLAAGELPIGAVVLDGDDIVGGAYTQEATQGRRLVHADLLAMEAADRTLRFAGRDRPLTLVVNLEPCLMCLGAATTLRVDRVWFGQWSPDDGGVDLVRRWRPPNPAFAPPPEILGGYRENEVRDQFRRYSEDPSRPAGMRAWSAGLGADPS